MYKKKVFYGLKRNIFLKKMVCLTAFKVKDAFSKLRTFNFNLAKELDTKKCTNNKDYFNDYLELKRLQREGTTFLVNSSIAKQDRSK